MNGINFVFHIEYFYDSDALAKNSCQTLFRIKLNLKKQKPRVNRPKNHDEQHCEMKEKEHNSDVGERLTFICQGIWMIWFQREFGFAKTGEEEGQTLKSKQITIQILQNIKTNICFDT